MIQVRNVSKRYGDRFAVQDISFDIEKGKIYGLLGPNGAGKSTTMNIMTGCLAPTTGAVTIDGVDILKNPIAAKKKIGYLPEIPPLYEEMTPYEYLSFVAEAKGVPYDGALRQVKEVLELTGTDCVSDRLIRNLSKGYKQRIGIAQALLGNPEIVILDEPTVGLDPAQILEMRNLIKILGQTKTVIVSSHILTEINAVCDHIMIISGGHLVANNTLEELEKTTEKEHRLYLTARGEAETVSYILRMLPDIYDITEETAEEAGTSRFSLLFDFDSDPRDTIFYQFAENKVPLIDMRTNRTTLEDVFLSLTSVPEHLPVENTTVNDEPMGTDYEPLFVSSETEDDQ